MNIKELNETELKALFYDNLVIMENAQAKIKAINEELSLRKQPLVEETKEENNG